MTNKFNVVSVIAIIFAIIAIVYIILFAILPTADVVTTTTIIKCDMEGDSTDIHITTTNKVETGVGYFVVHGGKYDKLYIKGYRSCSFKVIDE
jgi:hypothetical protein